MKSTGIVRKLDELGRITLPIELRRSMSIEEHDPFEILIENDTIVLRKYQDTDIFTGIKDELIEYHGKKVSRRSIMEMAKIAGIAV